MSFAKMDLARDRQPVLITQIGSMGELDRAATSHQQGGRRRNHATAYQGSSTLAVNPTDSLTRSDSLPALSRWAARPLTSTARMSSPWPDSRSLAARGAPRYERMLPPRWSLAEPAAAAWRHTHVPKDVHVARAEFEANHKRLLLNGCSSFRRAHRPSSDVVVERADRQFEIDLWELRWNRFALSHMPAKAQVPTPVPPKKNKPKRAATQPAGKRVGSAPWDVLATFWGARRDCDSESIYDSDVCYRAMADLDWQAAVADGRLERLVARTEKKSGGDGDDSDEGGELEDCEEALAAHAPLVYSLFDEYALHGGHDDTDDIFSIEKAGFTQFVEDVQIDVPKSKACRLSDLVTEGPAPRPPTRILRCAPCALALAASQTP